MTSDPRPGSRPRAKLSTTVIGVVGTDAAACVASLADAANVTAIRPSIELGPAERAREAWQRAMRCHSPYTVHDADPLEPVADAWARSFTDDGMRGELEVATSEAVARWRAGSIELPDYYFVIEPDGLEAGRRHWYLGVLHRAAAHRVVPIEAEGAAARAAIAHLRAGRWWPALPDLLTTLDAVLPDQLMTAQAEAEGLAAEEPEPRLGARPPIVG